MNNQNSTNGIVIPASVADHAAFAPFSPDFPESAPFFVRQMTQHVMGELVTQGLVTLDSPDILKMEQAVTQAVDRAIEAIDVNEIADVVMTRHEIRRARALALRRAAVSQSTPNEESANTSTPDRQSADAE